MSAVAPAKPHFGYIDCLRGYAVLMVLTTHFTYLFPNLPYPVHRVTATGWFGVQLFFVCSSLTLLMSWRHEEATRGRADTTAFFIRRFFRIAPAYYLCAAFYFVLDPPAHGFNPLQALASLAFVNGWHPLLTPTVAGRWTVVPGGWSIGVEFSFYVLFPLFAACVRSWRTASATLLATIIAGVVLDRLAATALIGSYGPITVDNFLFFWLPNQASVFACGAIVFLAIRGLDAGAARLPLPALWATAAVIAFVVLAFVPTGKYLGASPIVPTGLAVCVPLSIFVVALSRMRKGVFVTPLIAFVGKVSFSTYLLQFAVLEAMKAWLPHAWFTVGRYEAIAVFMALWPVAACFSVVVAWCSYRMIELPGMALGKALIRARRTAPA